MYWVPTPAAPLSWGNSSIIGRIIGVPAVCASSATRARYGMRDILRRVNVRGREDLEVTDRYRADHAALLDRRSGAAWCPGTPYGASRSTTQCPAGARSLPVNLSPASGTTWVTQR